MSWKKILFKNFKLYAVTDLNSDIGTALNKIDNVCRGGADIIQLRSKFLSDLALFQAGLKVKALVARHKKIFIVNDRPDLALLLGADGVHLGQDDLPVKEVRKLAARAGKKFLIGKSTHSLAQAKLAEKEQPDYIGVGPVFKTPTKPTYEPAGLDFVRAASQSVRIPFVAIGGIDLTNLNDVLAAGATRIAVVRALFDPKDSLDAAKKFRQKIDSFTR